jgi:hypothetical protein
MPHRIKHRASRETGANMKTGITGFMEQSPIRMAGKKKRPCSALSPPLSLTSVIFPAFPARRTMLVQKSNGGD